MEYKTDHILGHKANLNEFQIFEITEWAFDHNVYKLEIKNRKIPRKYPNAWKLNKTLLDNLKGIFRKIKKKYIELSQNKNVAYFISKQLKFQKENL